MNGTWIPLQYRFTKNIVHERLLQKNGCFFRSLRTLTVNYERNYVLFREPVIFIPPFNRLTALFQEFDVLGERLGKSLFLKHASR